MDEPNEEDRIRCYPPFVQTSEEERRWRLVTVAGLINYGFSPGDQLDRWDRMLIMQTQRTFFQSEFESGDGDVSAEQLDWLRSLDLV